MRSLIAILLVIACAPFAHALEVTNAQGKVIASEKDFVLYDANGVAQLRVVLDVGNYIKYYSHDTLLYRTNTVRSNSKTVSMIETADGTILFRMEAAVVDNFTDVYTNASTALPAYRWDKLNHDLRDFSSNTLIAHADKGKLSDVLVILYHMTKD